MTTETYNILNLVLQSVVAVAIICTFVVYYHQLQTMRRGSVGQNLLSLISFLQAPHVRDARTIVRSQLRTKSYENWTADEKRAADVVCSSYDIAAILILDERIVPASPILRNWGPSIADCFAILRPYVEQYQRPENSGAAYWDDFARLSAAVESPR